MTVETADTKGMDKDCLALLGKAANGNVEAQCLLGHRYLRGVGVKQNHSMAVEWLQKSAEKGYEDAEYLLGTCYENGTGVERNLTTAVSYYEKSARAANRYAQYALAEFWAFSGKHENATPWYLKSARQEYAPAQMALGKCYYYGLGSIKDEQLGLEWIAKAAHKNYEPALELYNELAK